MNLIWSRFLRSAYRSEPITSFVLTSGVVAAAIGGLDEQWSLLTFGLGTVGMAIALRWWQQQHRRPATVSDRPPTYALSPRSSRPVLPTLTLSQKPSDGRNGKL